MRAKRPGSLWTLVALAFGGVALVVAGAMSGVPFPFSGDTSVPAGSTTAERPAEPAPQPVLDAAGSSTTGEGARPAPSGTAGPSSGAAATRTPASGAANRSTGAGTPARPRAASAAGTVRPDSSNTGVPAGKSLTVHHGDMKITKAGAVIDSLDVRGFITVAAPDVTIRNSIIRGTATSKQRALVSATADGASVTIEDSELFAANPSGWIDGIRGWNITARRLDIHHVIDAVHIYGDNVTVESSWLHDNLHFTNDPAQGGKPSHDDSIQIQKGRNIRIVGNTIEDAFNTGIQFTQDQGVVSDVRIVKNWANGGGCTINLAEKGRGPFVGIVITDNTFGRDTKVSNCAIISPPTTVLTAQRNYFTDGAVATVRKGA